jgi:hypothetical protein
MDISELTETITKKFHSDRLKYSDLIKELTSYMKNMSSLAQSEMIFYKERQNIISTKFYLIENQIKILKIIEQKERDYLVSQKKNANLQDNSDSLIYAKNDFERKILMSNYMKDLNYLKNIIDAYINLTKETIQTIDNMTYGFQYVKELENYQNHFKK